MCIIVIKERGQSLPSKERMKTMFDANSDGAGFAYNQDGAVIIKKGFMDFKSFHKAVLSVEDVEAKGMLLHFRITTHGGSTPANTHPFPVHSKLNVISKLRNITDVAMVHNGIISSVSGYTKKYSDTMEFIMEQVAPLKSFYPNFYKNDKALKLLENLAGSKLAFIDGEGYISSVGAFITDDEDNLKYSNNSYTSYVWSGYTNSHYPYYDDKVFIKWIPSDDENYVLVNLNGEIVTDDYKWYAVGSGGAVYEYLFTGVGEFLVVTSYELWYKNTDGTMEQVIFTYDVPGSGEWLETSTLEAINNSGGWLQ